MTSKAFIQQRITNFAGEDIDLNSDQEIEKMLHYKFNIRLPQRPSLSESLASATSDHEIIDLLKQYRAMN